MDNIFCVILLASLAAVCYSQVPGIGGPLDPLGRPGNQFRCPAPRLVRPNVCFSQCSPNPRPRRLGGLPGCPGRNSQCCRNRCGAFVCTQGIPPWCPPRSPRLRCLVNPCNVLRCPRFPRAVCRPTNPCEPYCTGAFFIRGVQIPNWYCNFRPRPFGPQPFAASPVALSAASPVALSADPAAATAPDTPDI